MDRQPDDTLNVVEHLGLGHFPAPVNMTCARKRLFIAWTSALAILLAIAALGVFIRHSLVYPKPRGLPPVVDQTTEELLARVQSVLEAKAPTVARALRPGLSDAEIATLEARGGFRLSDDLRALYRWHNGMATNCPVGLLPGQRFIPLEEAVSEGLLVRQETANHSAMQRAAFSIFSGHRVGWLQVLDDGAGDGYFYDPNRSEAEGAFFQYFAEVGYYRWFPSLRNFLAGLAEFYEGGSTKLTADEKSLDEDVARIETIWTRYSKSTESGR